MLNGPIHPIGSGEYPSVGLHIAQAKQYLLLSHFLYASPYHHLGTGIRDSLFHVGIKDDDVAHTEIGRLHLLPLPETQFHGLHR